MGLLQHRAAEGGRGSAGHLVQPLSSRRSDFKTSSLCSGICSITSSQSPRWRSHNISGQPVPALKTLAWQDCFPLYPTGISLAATHDCCLLSLCCVLHLYTCLLCLLISKIHFLKQKGNFLYRILEVPHRNIGGK